MTRRLAQDHQPIGIPGTKLHQSSHYLKVTKHAQLEKFCIHVSQALLSSLRNTHLQLAHAKFQQHACPIPRTEEGQGFHGRHLSNVQIRNGHSAAGSGIMPGPRMSARQRQQAVLSSRSVAAQLRQQKRSCWESLAWVLGVGQR